MGQVQGGPCSSSFCTVRSSPSMVPTLRTPFSPTQVHLTECSSTTDESARASLNPPEFGSATCLRSSLTTPTPISTQGPLVDSGLYGDPGQGRQAGCGQRERSPEVCRRFNFVSCRDAGASRPNSNSMRHTSVCFLCRSCHARHTTDLQFVVTVAP
jgi:hypothetical protein